MINIIDHIWQVELKSYTILPTVIKFANNNPKSYYYSEKQNRVLRKKDQSIAFANDFLGKGNPTCRNYFLIKKAAANEVEYSLILKCEVQELLNNQSIDCTIIQLQQCEPPTLIIECTFNPQAKLEMKALMVYKRDQLFWSADVQNLELPADPVSKYMINLWKELPLLLKVKSKCRKIQFILSFSPSSQQINILWCNELIFDAKQFYQIRYSYRIKTIDLQVSKQTKMKLPQIKMEVHHRFDKKIEVQETRDQPLKQKSTQQKLQFICNGCGSPTVEQRCKQVQKSDVIALRRRNKLSIMGIKGEYLQVCEQCYYAIDQ